MGIKAGLTYGLGISLGFASFQASRLPQTQPGGSAYVDGNLIDLVAGNLRLVQSHVQQLASNGVGSLSTGKLDELTMKITPPNAPAEGNAQFTREVEGLRGDFRDTLARNSSYVRVYDLAVGIAIAEGQSSVPDPGTKPIMRDSLANSLPIAKELQSVVNPVLLEIIITGIDNNTVQDAHKEIQMIRETYQKNFYDSPIM
jgi:hypothetical protein